MMQLQTRKRAIASCSECYMRKQKCDRKYPCRHCLRRRRPEICSYHNDNDPPTSTPACALSTPIEPLVGGDRTIQGHHGKSSWSQTPSAVGVDNENSGVESRKEKLVGHHSGSETLGLQGSPPENPTLPTTMDDNSISLHLGYADHSQDNLAGLMKHFGLLNYDKLSNVAFHQIQSHYCKIMRENLPNRAIIDTLVQMFFQEANWMYEAIYSTTFLDQYQKWWGENPPTQIDDIIFATLLLRICAYTTQFLPSTTYTAATVCGESLNDIRQKCYNLATTLASLLKSAGARPSHFYVLQLFYAACYTKNEGHIRDAWDLLGEAIQTAVDLGMHEEQHQVLGVVLTDFEMEMRRRTFWNLYIWDRFMSTVLDRWPRIPEECCKVSYPAMQLSTNPTLLDAPDMFLERMLQVRLAQVWTSNEWPSYGQSKGLYDKHLIEAKHIHLHTHFILTLPPSFLLENPDRHWDKLVPSMKTRREILHLSIYALLSNLHRLVLRLKRKEIQDLSINERKLTYQHRIRFANYTLKLLSSVLNLHDLLGGSQNRLFILSFYIFEAGMQLGMYLLELGPVEDLYTRYHTSAAASPESTSDGVSSRPRDQDPWKKSLCLQGMEKALRRLHILSEVSSIARLGSRKLSEMIEKVKPSCNGDTPSSCGYSEDKTGTTVNSIASSLNEFSQNLTENSSDMSIFHPQAFDLMTSGCSVGFTMGADAFGGDINYYHSQLLDSPLGNTMEVLLESPHSPLLLSGDDYFRSFRGFTDFPPGTMDSQDGSDFPTSVVSLPPEQFFFST